MSRALRKQMFTMLNLLEKANRILKVNLTAKYVNGEEISQLLSECQETAIAMGNELEMIYGEGTATVHKLEEYCESLYQMTQVLHNPEERRTVLRKLTGQVKQTGKLLGGQIPDRREVVFLPYKASMWIRWKVSGRQRRRMRTAMCTSFQFLIMTAIRMGHSVNIITKAMKCRIM